jgi:hypothetical protein
VAGVAGQDAGRVSAETEAAGAGERGSRGAVIRSSRSVPVALVSRPGVEDSGRLRRELSMPDAITDEVCTDTLLRTPWLACWDRIRHHALLCGWSNRQ